jgi:hypothetical protein
MLGGCVGDGRRVDRRSNDTIHRRHVDYDALASSIRLSWLLLHHLSNLCSLAHPHAVQVYIHGLVPFCCCVLCGANKRPCNAGIVHRVIDAAELLCRCGNSIFDRLLARNIQLQGKNFELWVLLAQFGGSCLYCFEIDVTNAESLDTIFRKREGGRLSDTCTM